MITEDGNRHIKLLVSLGMIAIVFAMGYSLGISDALNSSANSMQSATMIPEAISLLEDARQRAHDEGDLETEEWLRQAAAAGRNRFLSWASARAHGYPDSDQSPQRRAASR